MEAMQHSIVYITLSRRTHTNENQSLLQNSKHFGYERGRGNIGGGGGKREGEIKGTRIVTLEIKKFPLSNLQLAL